MKELVSEAVMEMFNEGMISFDRIKDLIHIKEFIDRISTKEYLRESDAERIREKYGVLPNVVTWGDYFQTEMASSFIVLSDESFSKAVDAVKFDIISSYLIFSGKDMEFFEWVDNARLEIDNVKDAELTEEQEEIIHLKILRDYFTDLGITDNFTEEELLWHEGFQEAMAI